MVFVTFLLFIITTLSYAGNQIIAKIHAIDRGLTGEETLVFLTSGHVARSQDEKIIARLERAQNKKNWVRFNLNDSRIIESFDETESRFQTVKHGDNSSWQEVLYEPTLVENMTLANEYFREDRKSVV